MSNAAPRRTTVEVAIDAELLERARHSGLDLGRTLEREIEKVVGPADAEEKRRLWLEENRDAIESFNRYVEENDLPLSQYRRYPWPGSTST